MANNKRPNLSDDALDRAAREAGAEGIKEAMELVKQNLPSSADSEDDYAVPQVSAESMKDPRVAAVLSGGEDLKALKVSRLMVPPPLPPSHGTQGMAHGGAKLAKARQMKRGELLGTGPEAWKDKVSYIECDDQDCLGAGLWIQGDPRGSLNEKNWWSSYHALGSYWPPNQAPHCQVCEYLHGIRRPLRGVSFISQGPPGPTQRRTGMVVKPRFVRTLTRKEYDALVAPLDATPTA